MEDEETTPQESAGSGLETAAKILSLVYALLSVLWLLWIVIPEHQRRLMAMRAVARMHQTARRAAFRAGHQAMGRELSGHATSYEVPYRLSLAAEKTGKIYEKLRNV